MKKKSDGITNFNVKKKPFTSPNSTYVNVHDVKSPLSKPLHAVHGYQKKNLPRLKKGNSTTEISDPLLYGADTPKKKDNTMKPWMNNEKKNKSEERNNENPTWTTQKKGWTRGIRLKMK